MRPAWWWTLAVVTLAACKTELARRQEVAACSERTSDALEIELCLSGNYGWKAAEARSAAVARAKVLDSVRHHREDSVWARDAARHRDEIRDCSQGQEDLARCLLVRFGWLERRAVATAESVWRADIPRHRREIQDCSGQRQSSVGSCLMLRYKWPSERALALDDSIQRERMR